MPQVKTISSDQIWQSSDGQRTIWEVTLHHDDGKDYKVKTYSKKIAEMGFEGEVESYVNPRGEKFVRQTEQAGGYHGGKGSGNKQNNQPVIQAQWAIGQARGFIRDRGLVLPDDEYWEEVEITAKKLIETVNKILGGSESTNPKVQTSFTSPASVPPEAPVWPSQVQEEDNFYANLERGLMADGIEANA